MHGILDIQRIKQTTGLLLLASMIVIPWATPAGATIFWDDEMESGNTGYSLPGGAMTHDTSVKFSGNGSTRLDYPSQCLTGVSEIPCGGFTDRGFTGTTNKWTRFYFRMSPGFQVHPVSTKWIRSDTNGIQSTWWMMWWGSYNWGNTIQHVPPGESYNTYSSIALVPGQWYCIEMHEQLNTPGVANGIIESWVDGSQVMGLYNVAHRAAGDNSLLTNNRLYRQGGYGSIWLDKLAVGDQRIGCSGSIPKSDTTPPASPAGLTVR
jgi:hypothetical protein